MAGRLLTALVGAPLLIAAVWFGAPWLTIVVAVAALVGLQEYYYLVRLRTMARLIQLAYLWALALVLAAHLADRGPDYLPYLVLGGGGLLSLGWFMGSHQSGGAIEAWGGWASGPVYTAFFLSHALLIREMEGGDQLGRDWLLFSLLVVFATDTGAFFVGRKAGRRRMAPTISPGKTWEGAFGGFLWAVVVALILSVPLELSVPYWQAGAVGAVIGVVAQIGDLLESRLKRAAGVKDSGRLLPGHGGILDRADSIVLVLPAVYYLLTIVVEPG